MRIAFTKCHGSGNDFPLIDARALALGDRDWAAIARALADRAGPVGGDGLLLLTGGDDRHDFGMRMFNSDGSEAETCLNGLRCVARAGFEALGLDTARVRLKTSWAQASRVDALAPDVVTVRTVVGPASLAASDVGLGIAADAVLDAPILGLPSARHFTAVAMPNPHLVAFVDVVDEAELVALGAWCETGPALIPARANVSFVEVREGGLFVRTFERGVGLTNSCGSAMAASVLAAALTGHVAFEAEIAVFNKGGLVRGRAGKDRVVTISGNATFEYDAAVEVDPETGMIGEVEDRQARVGETTAWAKAVAALAR